MNNFFVHETSLVEEGCIIGEGTTIWHFSRILRGSNIGKNCVFGQNCVIGPNVKIGNGCKIQNNVSIYYNVTLEDDVFIGPSITFTNVNNPRAFINRMNETRPTLIKKGSSVGANATIVCGHTIGCYAFVGAGSVVTKDVPDFALVVGNPAKIIGWMCVCANKIDFKLKNGKCPVCGKEYKMINKNSIYEII
jgi:UDP-2-acetamido-3-amino-2,3-dideoxy-glucuronate N-acetyltransferase